MASIERSARGLAFAPSLTSVLCRPMFARHPRRAPGPPRAPSCAVASSAASSPSPPSSLPRAVSDPSRPAPASSDGLTFQDAIRRLQEYWASKGCILWHPYNTEVGAGTMNPATFLRVLGPEPWSVAYDEPSIRPDDSRYGQNPNRLQRHTQFQVIVKPAPTCAQELVVGSYQALGIDTCAHDVRFVEDNWESPALGAWGLGWEVWLDGMEVTQFTYFQQAGGVPLDSVAVEITYGLERIIMSLQGKSHFKDIVFAPGITYGEIFMQNEFEMSKYNLDNADISRNNTLFDAYEAEATQLLRNRLPVPAYNYLLKASHTFNVLDARGAVGVTERARYFQRMRNLARDVAKLWVERREEIGFPLLSAAQSFIGNSNGNGTPTPSTIGVRQSHPSVLGVTADLVFEIGVEELPASDVAESATQLEKLMSDLLASERLAFSSIDVSATPRRVTAVVHQLQTRQEDETNRVRGPPLSIAVGKDGKLTKAGSGFLKSQGIVGEGAIELDEAEGYMYGTVQNVGRTASAVLCDLLPSAVISKLSFKKSMRWNDSRISFSRPVRWLLCLLDSELVPVEFAGVQSAKTTRSLRSNDGFAVDVLVDSAAEYKRVLADHQIVLSRKSRSDHIRIRASELAAKIGGIVPESYLTGELMEEVTDLVENPIPLIGRFDRSFLDLPEAVLITVMKKHQRYFPVMDKEGDQLLNAFVTVANGDVNEVDVDAIRAGNEAVLRARYSDAAFFYDKDTKSKKLGDFTSKLSGLTFQESLGSMLDKVNRLSAVVPELCSLMKLSHAESDTAVFAAALCKSDLATSMVVEMTSLAGIMGRHYAQKSGEASAEVAEAIFEASLPRFSGDQLAKSKAGAVVGIADRVDSLVALFSVGLAPKATADPFALRRAALGIVQTLIETEVSVNLNAVVEASSAALRQGTTINVEEKHADAILKFIEKRLETYLSDSRGILPDVVKAVLAVESNASDPYSAARTAQALQDAATLHPEVLSNAIETHERAARLLKSVKGSGSWGTISHAVDVSLFDCDEEASLLRALTEAETTVTNSAKDSLDVRLRAVGGIKGVVDAFFDGVFVNTEDEAIRLNRLALSARVVAITSDIVDLGCLRGTL